MTYEGNFINDVMHGQGRLSFPNGNVFEGNFSRSNPYGKGSLTTINGERFEGDWEYQGRAHYSNHPVGKYIFRGNCIDLKSGGKPVVYCGPSALHWDDGFITFPGMPEDCVSGALPYAVIATNEMSKEGQKLFQEAIHDQGGAVPQARVVETAKPSVSYGQDDPALRPLHPNDHAAFNPLDPRLYIPIPFAGGPTNVNAKAQEVIRQNNGQNVSHPSNTNPTGVW